MFLTGDLKIDIKSKNRIKQPQLNTTSLSGFGFAEVSTIQQTKTQDHVSITSL